MSTTLDTIGRNILKSLHLSRVAGRLWMFLEVGLWLRDLNSRRITMISLLVEFV